MLLINANTGEKLQGTIEKIGPAELKHFAGNRAFDFDWRKEAENEVYKIRLRGKKEILGLMSVTDVRKEFRIHINLIESGKPYRGKEKKIKNVPGCLISHACILAFQRGYDGFVSLVPKTELTDYYHQKVDFLQVGRHMAIFMEASQRLISKYHNDEEI